MATNNDLLEWAVVFTLALSQWTRGESIERSARETNRFLRDRFNDGSRLRKQAMAKIYELRSQLPGVLTLSGLKPAEIETIVAAFDKRPNIPVRNKEEIKEVVYWRNWLDTYIKPLVKFPRSIRANGLDWIK